MSNNILQINNQKEAIIVKIQEILLIIFIVLSPIYKCLTGINIAGYNPITIVVGLLLVCYTLNLYNTIVDKQQRFFSITILLFFCIEVLFISKNNRIGWILPILLYAFFLQTDIRVSIRRVYKAFFLSSIIAAFFSLIVGFSGGVVTRAAASVDGSIAPITVTILLFCDTESEIKRSTLNSVMKVAAMISSIIVLIFGMSRARVLIVVVCFLIYGLSKLTELIKNGGRVSRDVVSFFIMVLILVSVLFFSGAIEAMIEPILERFSTEGLNSMGRNVEAEFGINLFKENVLFGGGWGSFSFVNLGGSVVEYDNHSAYIAVLARGGLFLAVPIFLSYYLLMKKAILIREKSRVAWVMMLVFLLLSYGNAGMFNYTICSLIPLVVLDIKKRLYNENY